MFVPFAANKTFSNHHSRSSSDYVSFSFRLFGLSSPHPLDLHRDPVTQKSPPSAQQPLEVLRLLQLSPTSLRSLASKSTEEIASLPWPSQRASHLYHHLPLEKIVSGKFKGWLGKYVEELTTFRSCWFNCVFLRCFQLKRVAGCLWIAGEACEVLHLGMCQSLRAH